MKKTKQLTTMGMLIALSIVLMLLIRFPLFPSAPYLEYEPMDIPLLIAGFTFGPVLGITCVIISSLIQALTVSAGIGGFVGALMHIIASGTLVGVSSIIYKKNKSKKGAFIALALGVVAMCLVMIPANLIITTNFYGVPKEVVTATMFTVTIPFNFLKAGINSLCTFLLYKPLKNIINKGNL